jgi:2-polyprenyl-3-methyl-5-hydroxy-6-metoxy-1,4-benzoquinol methylase
MAVDVHSLECPLCDEARIEVKYEAARDYLTGDEFKVLECMSCRVAFTHPVPENMSRYYPLQYRAYKGPILKILGAFYQAKANGWSRLFPQPGRLLEIGCGPGLMLKSMRDLGWDVMGLERNEHAAGYGRKEYGLQILACDVDQLPPQTFDLIILFQVLEHIQDPKTILASCYHRLNPGGRIVIGVPNFHSWQAEVGKTEWLHLDIPRHLFHFLRPPCALLLATRDFAIYPSHSCPWSTTPMDGCRVC